MLNGNLDGSHLCIPGTLLSHLLPNAKVRTQEVQKHAICRVTVELEILPLGWLARCQTPKRDTHIFNFRLSA
jgi:hypothetical protein